jgi:hypothetical protein
LDRPGRPRKKALLASRSKTRRRARRREGRKEGRMLLLLVVDDEDDGLKPISTHLKRAREGRTRVVDDGNDDERGDEAKGTLASSFFSVDVCVRMRVRERWAVFCI